MVAAQHLVVQLRDGDEVLESVRDLNKHGRNEKEEDCKQNSRDERGQ